MKRTQSQHGECGILSPGLGGGPKGLGDPNDRTIREIENELIVKKMWEESKKLFHNEDFLKKIRDLYVDEQSEYCHTGVTFPEREWLEKEYKKWSKENEDGHTNSNTS